MQALEYPEIEAQDFSRLENGGWKTASPFGSSVAYSYSFGAFGELLPCITFWIYRVSSLFIPFAMGLLMTLWLDSVDGMNARMNRTLYKGKVHGSAQNIPKCVGFATSSWLDSFSQGVPSQRQYGRGIGEDHPMRQIDFTVSVSPVSSNSPKICSNRVVLNYIACQQDSSPDTPGLPRQDGGFDECAEYNGVFASGFSSTHTHIIIYYIYYIYYIYIYHSPVRV